MSDPDRVFVVGSGPNGLAAALCCAMAGREVTVLEGSDTLGGSARTAELTLPGFRHDICSAVHPMAAGGPLIPRLGLEKHGLDWVQPPAALTHPLEGWPAAILEQGLTARSLEADARAWEEWVGPFVRRWPELAADALGPPGVPRSPVLLARFGLQALQPTSRLTRRFLHAPAKALFAGLAAHSLLPLDQPPAAAIGLILGLAGHAVGWPFPRGGAQAIPDAMAALLRQLGGRIELGHTVIELPDEGTWFFETSPGAMVEICGGALPAGYASRLLAFRHGPGVFKLDWALSEPIPWSDPSVARSGIVHLGGTLEEIALSEQTMWEGQHPERPYVLVAQHSLFDPSRAPEGRHTGWAYCHVPAGSTVDMTAAIEAQVERFAPGFRDTILARHAMDCAAWEQHNPNYVGGDINGGANTLDQLFTRPVARWTPWSTPNPRVWLCSASTPPGGGVHGLCGWHAANAWLGRDAPRLPG